MAKFYERRANKEIQRNLCLRILPTNFVGLVANLLARLLPVLGCGVVPGLRSALLWWNVSALAVPCQGVDRRKVQNPCYEMVFNLCTSKIFRAQLAKAP